MAHPMQRYGREKKEPEKPKPEPTLYRQVPEHNLNDMGECINYRCSSRLTQFYQVIPAKCDGFVPVERCEHGFIDGHDTEYNPIKDRKLDGHWCRGAALGCNCEACASGPPHMSDCAVHGVDTGIEGYGPEGDGISYEGPCDCRG